MPLNAPIKDRVISARHLTSQPKFKGANLAVISNMTESNTPETNREYVVVMAVSLTNITRSGAQTIDGVSITAGMTVLVNGQTDKKFNGLYICQTGAWTRVSDIDMISGFLVVVRQGTANANTLWMESLEFDFYTVDVTELEWVNTQADVSISVTDTDTVDLILSGTDISADVRYQDTNSIQLSEDAGGLRADVRLATASVGMELVQLSPGLRVNHRLAAGRGINLISNSPGSGQLEILNNVASGVGVKILANIPSPGVLTANHDINGAGGIQVLENNPSTGNLRVQIQDGGVSTAKLADDAVTTDKIADGAVRYNQFDAYSGSNLLYITDGGDGSILFAIDDDEYSNNLRQYTFNTGGTTSGTVKTFRIPSDTSEYLPRGWYHIDVYGQFTAVASGMPPRVVRHTTAPVLSVKVGGGSARNLDRGATHADPASGTHIFINTSLSGGCLINLTSTTMTDRYFEIEFDLSVSDLNGAANFASVSNGTCDVFRLTVPSTQIEHET